MFVEYLDYLKSMPKPKQHFIFVSYDSVKLWKEIFPELDQPKV